MIPKDSLQEYRRAGLAKRGDGIAIKDFGQALDVRRMRAYRLERVRSELRRRDIGACILFQPDNIRYATGHRNMQIYARLAPIRYLFLPVEGPIVLFDYFGSEHLSAHLETIAEVRPAIVWDHASAGDRAPERISRFVAVIVDMMRAQCGSNRRIGLDILDMQAVAALRDAGLDVHQFQEAVDLARTVKCADEILGISHAMAVCEAGVAEMCRALEPGITENELWSLLHRANIARGGEFIETRLLCSGSHTNPWYQESSDRIIRSGDLVAFDTDLVGPMGFGCDISRTILCGDGRPSDEQKRLYNLAMDNLRHNINLIEPGMSYRDYVRQSWKLPDEFVPRRYAKILHGVGLGFEYPNIPYANDWETHGYDGVIEENMVLSVESYIAPEDGFEGIKLEEQVLVTPTGAQIMSACPYDERFF